MTHRALLGVTLAAGVMLGPATLVAHQAPQAPRAPVAQQAPQTPQAPTQAQQPVTVFQDFPNAQVTFEELHRILRQLPPAVGEVLSRDPSLLNRADYLAPYPVLVAFLQQHPEIARNPSFFLGSFEFRERDPRERAINLVEEILAGIGLGSMLILLSGLVAWVLRTVIDHRRWLRLSRVQVEVHTKLLDRLQSNEDLLAYMQTPAGRRFLESAPITLDGETRPGGAPVARIVLSLQAGVVLIALGIGLRFVEWNMIQEVAEGFRVLGIIAIALGVGFAASAIVAYLVSVRLGLLSGRKAEASTT